MGVKKVWFSIFFLGVAMVIFAQKMQIQPALLPDPQEIGGRVNCIFQDKSGFLWIGKETGLFRFDGNSVLAFRFDPLNPNSIGGNNVRVIAEDSCGDLWIGTKGGGLNHFSRKSQTFTRYQHNAKNLSSISHDEVQAILPAENGNFLIGTDGGGLNFFETKTRIFKAISAKPNTPNFLKRNNIINVSPAANGKYWISTWGGLMLYDPLAHTLVNIGEGTPYELSKVLSAKEIKPGVVWVATYEDGLLAYNVKNNQFTQIVPKQVIDCFRDIQLTPAGEVWVASHDGLLYFKTPQSNYQLFTNPTASLTSFTNIFIDHTQTVWARTSMGALGKINSFQKKFYSLQSIPSIAKLAIHSIVAQCSEPYVFFTTRDNLIEFNPTTGGYQLFNIPSQHPFLIAATHGNQLIGTGAAGLVQFNCNSHRVSPLQLTSQTRAAGVPELILSLYSSSPTGCWVANNASVYRIDYNVGQQQWQKSNELPVGENGSVSKSHNPTCFLQQPNGDFWIGTYGGGLNRRKAGKNTFEYLLHDASNKTSLSNNFIESLAQDPSGNIWVGTQAGLNKYNAANGTFSSLLTANGLADDWIMAIATDAKKRVWITTRRGLICISSDLKTIKNYDVVDGLPANEFIARSVSTDKAGNIYFGSTNGLVWFHPDSIKDNPYAPQPAITGIRINGQNVNLSTLLPQNKSIENTGEIHLKYHQNSFSIQLAALSYFNPKKNKVRYKLEGVDTSWLLAGKEQVAEYKNIKPGTYTFQVMASNDDGVWNNKPRSVTISISRPPWLSSLAIIVYMTVMAGLTWAYFIIKKKNTSATKNLDTESPMPNRGVIQPSMVEITPSNQQFLQKAIAVVEANISDPDFGVDQFCEQIHTSRPQLYRKINSIAGVTVSEFIKEVRLKRAAQLLEQKTDNISEIAFKVGFNDPRYFRKCFKQHFGVAPAQYVAQNNRILPPN